ncbi:Fibrous sheath-interacting protein 2 [Platysternon megacephalum]|uniref:Fibrous sheath-interacting protein 2 n=1 Tax=Platysternon megacephalum TaxID=55544 RepID=A0A4D9E166_9SAUR|nr:Fibrous sheath-interacting protein 2 [Platysternon megacephalum]
MASLNWRMLKAAMEHYLSAGSQTADEVLKPEEKLGEISHRRQLLGIGPTQLLDMPLGAKLPLLPGSNTLFYRTNLGEKLYQPPSGFDLGDPYCRLMTTKYRSLHDPHLRSYYKRKNNLRRLKKGGYVTNDNKVVCTLKEFNEYRQYLSTLKLEFEKNYMREQKMLEKQVTKLRDPILLPEGADTSHFREWLLREERENLQERERQMRNRYVDMINKELEKIKCIVEEKHLLQQAEEEKRQHEKKKKKQPILHIKMEEEWKQKEMLLLLKIGEDVKREARIEELRGKRREEKAKKKRTVLEKKMAYHLRKLQEHDYQRVEFESHKFEIYSYFPPGANLSSRPSINGKVFTITSLSSVVSQQGFDEIANNVTDEKRKSLRNTITEELNNTIENILTRVVAEVTSILYPAVTEYEERIRDTVYTISEESALSSDNSSSCSTCNEELFDVFASLPSSSTRKVIFTDTSIKATSSPSDLKRVTGGKPTPLQSQKSSFMSLSKSTQRSLESEFWKESVHKGKTATPPHHHTESISKLRREVVGMGAMSEFPTKTFNTEKFPFSQTYFKHESATKDTKPKKGLIGEDIFSDLNQDLPKGGIFKKVFDKQTVTDANDNDNLKMLQVAENVVKEVFRRVKDLSDSVSILKKAPIELSERLFCSSFKRTEFPETFHKEVQKEIGLVAKEIVATVFDNFHKCLVSSITMASDQEPVIRRKDQVPARRTSRVSKSEKNKIMQAELPAYDPTFSSFTIDKIAKEAVESVVFTLESFVAFQFKHDFKCKFSEIVKLPVENISSAQQTPFLRPLSTHIANEIEVSSKAFEGEMPGTTSKRTLPTLEQFQSSSDVSRVSSMITKESIESAIVQVQGLHSELNIYATIAVNDVLEIFKRKLEKEISQRQTIPLYDDSEENIMAGEIIGAVLDRCAQPQTEITLELKSGNLEMEKSGRTFGNNKIHGQGVAMSEGIKLPARKLKEIDPRENFPPINVPGMVIYSEEETEIEEEIPSRLCPTIHKFSERDAHTPSEVTKKSMYYMSASTARPSRPSLGTITKQRAISSRMTLPPIGKQFPRKPFSPLGIMKSPRDEARHRQVYEEHCQFMSTHETMYQLSQSQDCTLPAIVVEEIISKLVSTILNSVCSTSLEHKRCLSKTEVNEITDTLKQSVKKRMSKNKISLVGAADEDQHLNPEYEDTLNQVVQSIYNSVLQETGSQPALYHDVTSCRTVFPERTASIIINEISSGQLIHSFNEQSLTDNYSTIEVDTTADKDLSSVSIQINIEAGSSGESMSDANGHPAETLLQEEELPVEIIAHIRDKPLDIDPDLISDHLAVISIKTEPIEKWNETYTSHSGLELPELRKASISKTSMLSTATESDIEKRRERRSSVNALGRLDVKPKDVVCRNSFQNLKKPDVTRVELLKDVKSKEELILRLVSYDIQHDEDEDFEQIVKVDSASVFESQAYAAGEEEIMPAYESAPLADMQNNLIAAQAPEKEDQYKIMEETILTNLAGPKLDIDLLSALSKGIPCLSESVEETSPVPETQDKDKPGLTKRKESPYADNAPGIWLHGLIMASEADIGIFLYTEGDAAVSESSTPSSGASVPENVPGVLSTVFSQSCSSTSDISSPTPATP